MPRGFKLRPYTPANKYSPKKRKTEESLQRRVCTYIRRNYPHIYFRSDTASGMYLSPYQATIHHSQQSGPGQCDLMIFYPNFGYHGMLLEIKKEKTRIYIKNGSVVADPHIKAQVKVKDDMNELGYFAEFGIGYDDCIKKIDTYLGKPVNEELELNVF